MFRLHSTIVLVTLFVLLGMRPTALQAQEFNPAATTLQSTFTYQGYVEQSGIPVTAVCDFQFSLFDALSGGAQVGSTLTRANVSVTGGIFVVQLDFGATAFAGDDRYVAISVRCPAGGGAYTALTPRQAITPAPYATYATRAAWGGLQGVPPGFADGVDNTGGAFWSLTGNAGTNPATQFIGTTDNVALEFHVNNLRVMRYEPGGGLLPDSPNVIGGSRFNAVTAGVYGATISGGGLTAMINNEVTANLGTVGGGIDNTASGFAASVSGGYLNTASNGYAIIGGGENNDATGLYSAISGGFNNLAAVNYSFVGGGDNNFANGSRATISGGSSNNVTGEYATIPGGRSNVASGNYTFAAGRRAVADDLGAFVWGDGTDADIASPGDNTFIVRAAGGIWFGTTSSPSIPAGRFINTSTGAFLTTGGAWTNASDVNAKSNFAEIDPQAVLETLMAIPVTTWNYIAEGDAVRRMGPMAQDFYAAYGLGDNDTSISTIDAQGVAFAAIQGLYQRSEAENALLQTQIDALQAENVDLQARIERLEAIATGGSSAGGAPLAVIALMIGGGVAGVVMRRRAAQPS
jgi:hypothetical protein